MSDPTHAASASPAPAAGRRTGSFPVLLDALELVDPGASCRSDGTCDPLPPATPHLLEERSTSVRALQISEYGDNGVLTVTDVSLPAPEGRQVLLDVRAAALNPLDATLRSGYAQALMPLRFPATLGGDVAGVVSAVGPDVAGLAVGDRVYGNAYTLLGGSGAIAEQALVLSDHLVEIPDDLDFVEAASMPVAGTTAVEAVNHSLQLQPGQRIFISGASGAVGSVAVQVAKHLGAYVAATASGDGVDLVRGLGADEVFDYTTTDFSDHLRDYDAVLDAVGGRPLEKSYGILKRGGTLVTVIGELDQAKADALGLTVVRQATQSEGVLRELNAYLGEGAVTPRVGRTYPLEEAAAAFTALEDRAVRGKVVIVV